MEIHVYQMSDHDYGAGFIKDFCAEQGKIVETWPINTASEAKFVATHGSNYGHISSRVSALADAAHKLLYDGGKLVNAVIIDQDEWNLLINQKQTLLNEKKREQIIRLRHQKELAVSKTKERCAVEIESVKMVCDEMLSQAEDRIVECEVEKQDYINSLTGRGFFRRIALAFRIVFLRKT